MLAAIAIVVVALISYLLLPTSKTPALAFDKLDVDLGTVAQDQQAIQTFLVMNRGDGPLSLGPASIEVEEGCDVAETPARVVDLQSDEHMLLPVGLGPHRETGPHRIRINVPSDDPSAPMTTLSVRFDVRQDAREPGTGPRLRVDKELIDIGTVPYDSPMYEQFVLRNEGDAPLLLYGLPIVRVEEGCWPPEPAVGSTALQPGEQTTLELPLFMGMHQGMGGPHVFAVDIRTNDPLHPIKTLRWLFNVADTEG